MTPCKKRAYESKEIAKAALEEVLAKSDRKKKPQRVYRCEHCKMWHLTSFSKKKYRWGVAQGGFKELKIERIAEYWLRHKPKLSR